MGLKLLCTKIFLMVKKYCLGCLDADTGTNIDMGIQHCNFENLGHRFVYLNFFFEML